MAKLSPFKRLIKEDFKSDYYDLIDKLAFSLNPTLEGLANSFDKSITFEENIASQTKIITIKVDNNGKPTTEPSFQSSLKAKVNGIFCIREDNLTNSSIYPSSGVFCSFTESSSIITIKHITGLSASDNHRLVLLLI